MDQAACPTLESTLDSAHVEASYEFSDRLHGTFHLRYERFDLKDWALVSETTLPTVLTLGAQPYDYDVYAMGIGIRYRFGDGDDITGRITPPRSTSAMCPVLNAGHILQETA